MEGNLNQGGDPEFYSDLNEKWDDEKGADQAQSEHHIHQEHVDLPALEFLEQVVQEQCEKSTTNGCQQEQKQGLFHRDGVGDKLLDKSCDTHEQNLVA